MTNASYERLGRRSGPGRAIAGVVFLAAAAVITGVIFYNIETPGPDAVRSAADETAYELERTPVPGLGVYVWDVQHAMAEGTRDSRGRSAVGITVTDAGSDARGELFQIANRKGRYLVCLIVSVPSILDRTGPVFPTVDVQDGAC